MVVKFISLVIAMCVGELLALGLQSPSDSLFLMVSNNPVVVSLRVAITLAMLVVAFRLRFANKLTRRAAGLFGVFLVLFSIIGVASNKIDFAIVDYVKAFDYLIFLEMGVVFMLAAATYKAGRRKVVLRQAMTRKLPRSWTVRLSHS